ncbi:hypothetical protein CRE_23055 [Caenorhabditis remanei]|uniref:Sdz-33 F-box domain-containing protein n=1 Tax=Caenorhabditis remanei TaxID=31234 RepID=E3N9E2_CAERE|nr:hypothetical protein CRE_23055 [Caenorhabditis remanei]
MLHFRFFISLVSSKTKNLVTSLGLRADCVSITITSILSISVDIGRARFHLIIFNNSNDENGELTADITLPGSAFFYFEDNAGIQLTTQSFNFSNWLNHIQSLFCWLKPPNVYFARGCEIFEVQSLKDAIGNVNDLFVPRQLTDVLSREVLKQFNTPNILYLHKNPFEDVSEIQKFFIQNRKSIIFDDVYSLDDMLLANSKRAELTHPISQKQFNQFVKHWIRGSNPRLQCMSLAIDKFDFPSGEVYLKGIRCTAMEEKTKQKIRENHSLSENVDVVQVRRKDGTPAVVVTKDSEHVLYVRFIVLY